jgi:hypothetical protein
MNIVTWKFGLENSFFEMEWGTHTLGTFVPYFLEF